MHRLIYAENPQKQQLLLFSLGLTSCSIKLALGLFVTLVFNFSLRTNWFTSYEEFPSFSYNVYMGYFYVCALVFISRGGQGGKTKNKR